MSIISDQSRSPDPKFDSSNPRSLHLALDQALELHNSPRVSLQVFLERTFFNITSSDDDLLNLRWQWLQRTEITFQVTQIRMGNDISGTFPELRSFYVMQFLVQINFENWFTKRRWTYSFQTKLYWIVSWNCHYWQFGNEKIMNWE